MTQEKILTANVVVDLLKQIAVEFPDKIAECDYRHCIVGAVIRRWDEGAYQELVSQSNVQGNAEIGEVFGQEGMDAPLYDLSYSAEQDAVQLLSSAQYQQDNGKPWAYAVNYALGVAA